VSEAADVEASLWTVRWSQEWRQDAGSFAFD
jgi:hypothetical protein